MILAVAALLEDALDSAREPALLLAGQLLRGQDDDRDRRGARQLASFPHSITAHVVDEAGTIYAGLLRFDISLMIADGL